MYGGSTNMVARAANALEGGGDVAWGADLDDEINRTDVDAHLEEDEVTTARSGGSVSVQPPAGCSCPSSRGVQPRVHPRAEALTSVSVISSCWRRPAWWCGRRSGPRWLPRWPPRSGPQAVRKAGMRDEDVQIEFPEQRFWRP